MKTPNGEVSWVETHFKIACHIGGVLSSDDPLIGIMAEVQENIGHYGLCDLCTDLTDEFEGLHPLTDWIDLDWSDTLDKFLKEKLS